MYGTVLPFNNVASAFLQHRNFMSHDGEWYGNRTYVVPKDCVKFEANKTMCELDSTNSSLHAHFWLKNHSLTHANVTDCNVTKIPDHDLITGNCSAGYELHDSATPLQATCCAGTGNMTLTASSGRCVPKANTTACSPTSWELNAIFPAANHTGTATAINCTWGYTFYRGNGTEDRGPPVVATCDNGVWKRNSDARCVPIANDYEGYCKAQDDAEVAANRVMSIPYIISAVISPFLGFLIDKIGKRAILATLAPAVLILVHSLLAFTEVTP